MTISQLDGELPTGMAWGASSTYLDGFFTIGGLSSTSTGLEKISFYNATTNTLSEKTTMPSLSFGLGADRIDDLIVIYGGATLAAVLPSTNNLFYYNISSNNLVLKSYSNGPDPLYYMSVVANDRFIYIFGGRKGNNQYSDEIHRLDVDNVLPLQEV
eukprot:CAMPEP_0117420016 /NCGR_PEP_ID=MMETSP0758-20121206/1453_1 /TAXON_ID=63605 /ORGANISM="Percolomonas cosmopolitus, Strain AE-1 (ATCC 50343)" /LENGTH=156 /DNA_ID=CAMNT_0005201409 /DNA_START=562 /DNA_END=1033 /DNA_ORIENTATION=-